MDTLIAFSINSVENILQSLHSSISGVTEKEAEKRIKTQGYNHIIEKNRFVVLKLLWASFFSPLILLLLIASLISSLLGDFKDFFIIFSIVVLSGSITFYQHFKAEHAAEKLKKKVQLFATAIRDGIKREIPFAKIVPGDVIILEPGDLVPADGRIIESKNIAIDESTLTGESFPSQKSTQLQDKNPHNLSQLNNIVFAGTHVTSGEATIIIFATGKLTQLGKLSHELVKPKPPTDFDQGIQHLSVLMIKVILLLCLFVFGVNAIIHHEIIISFTFAVALAVGLTPELMPVILTINLSRGAILMEKKEVIVKYLPAIQNFGSMDILCTDKTGTLTESTISLVDYQSINQKKSQNVLIYGVLSSTLNSGIKDPLDQALLNHTKTLPLSDYKKIDEIPFDFIRKRSSVVVEYKNKQLMLITKGAPQKILPLCTKYQTEKETKNLSPTISKNIEKTIEQLNKQGFRVIAIASKKVHAKSDYEISDENNLSLLGYLIFQDPIKLTTSTTIQNLKHLGILLKILTGDNELVTQKVCNDVNIPILGTLTGEEIDAMNDQQLTEKADKTTIFARLTPEQKSRIINALKNNNHVVGYMGDGINDAPPLKSADVGISVNNGSDIARDVADIVLMHKSLSILKEGVLEGRKTHVNIFKYIFMSLSSNFGNMMSIAAASLFLPFLPLLPIQILLIDFLYDFSQISIPLDNVDKDSIKNPQKWNINFLKKFMLIFGPLSSVFDIFTFLGLLFIFHSTVNIFRTGWFLESIITQTLIIFILRTKVIPFFKSLPSLPVVITAITTILIGFILVFSSLAPLFNFYHLPNGFMIFMIMLIIIYITSVELGKMWFYKFVSS